MARRRPAPAAGRPARPGCRGRVATGSWPATASNARGLLAMDAGRAIHSEPSGLHGQPLERVLVAATGLQWNAAEAAGGRSGARGCGRAVRIFLSYRRGDVGGYAGRLADALHERMGAKSVFQDVLDIAPGQDYTAVIDRALDNSDALLAVIGPGWLAASTPQGSPRLFAGDDYVRLEIARALDRDVRVVPVLVGGAVAGGCRAAGCAAATGATAGGGAARRDLAPGRRWSDAV